MFFFSIFIILAAFNLARGKPTRQSFGDDSAKAVNGDYDDFTLIAPPSANDHKWWLVTLGNVYGVAKIVLYNRRDCCGNKI